MFMLNQVSALQNFKNNIFTSKSIRVGCAGLTAVALSLGTMEVLKRKDALTDFYYRQDNRDNVLKITNGFFSNSPSMKGISAALIKSEGIRTTIYNDASPNISYKVAQKNKVKGNYTVGIGHKISKQSGDLIENLQDDLKVAKKLTGMKVSTNVVDEKLSTEQITMLFVADLYKAEARAKQLTEGDLKDFPISQVCWDDLASAKKMALISIVFNTGHRKVAYYDGNPTKLLTNFRAGNWEKAQAEFDFWGPKGKVQENTIGKRYLEMFLVNDKNISDKSKEKLMKALNRAGFGFKNAEEANKYLEKKYDLQRQAFIKSDIW